MHIVTALRGKQLKIDFDPEIFGMRKNAFGKDVPIKGVKFNNFTYLTEDDEVIERLRVHPMNTANGGTGFRIESTGDSKEMLDAAGIVSVTAQDLEVTNDDREALTYIYENKDDIPNDRSKLLNSIEFILERFGVTSLRVPHIKSKDNRIMLVIYELLEVLEEKDIWPEKIKHNAIEIEVPEEIFIDEDIEEKLNDRKRNNRKGKASK